MMTVGSDDRKPRRLLSLAPNVSMILFALGADEAVVGRTQIGFSFAIVPGVFTEIGAHKLPRLYSSAIKSPARAEMAMMVSVGS